MYDESTARVAKQLLINGLRVAPEDAIKDEKLDALNVARDLIDQGHDPDELVDAAAHGMSNVWPFNEGQAWDPYDFKKNVSKAKAEARGLRRSGNIPTKASEL